MTRLGTTSITTEVEIDVDDIVADISDAEIIDICRSRGLLVLGEEYDAPVMEVVRDLILAKLYQDALSVIEKHLAPVIDRTNAYAAAKRNRDSSGRPVIQ